MRVVRVSVLLMVHAFLRWWWENPLPGAVSADQERSCTVAFGAHCATRRERDGPGSRPPPTRNREQDGRVYPRQPQQRQPRAAGLRAAGLRGSQRRTLTAQRCTSAPPGADEMGSEGLRSKSAYCADERQARTESARSGRNVSRLARRLCQQKALNASTGGAR